MNETKFNGGSAVADIDLNGDMEVIVADVHKNFGGVSYGF